MSYTFSLSRRSLPVRCLCLLLIVLVLWCFFMVPRAGAVALEATTIAYGGLLVGTILVGAGVVFSSHGDMVKVGNAMYKTLVNGSSAIGKTISSISAWAVEHGTSLAKGALRVGKDLYQGIVDAFNASYSNGKVSLGADVVTLPTDPTEEEIKSFCNLFANKDIKSFYFSEYAGQPDEIVHHAYFTRVGSVYTLVVTNPRGGGETYERTIDVGNDTVTNAYLSFDYDSGWMNLFLNVEKGASASYVYYASSVSWGLSASLSPISVSVPQPDLKYPSDDYLVRMPDIPSVDSATGDITYPNDTAYTKDAVAVPYPVDTEGVKVPDIPYDKIVDQSTGKALDDTGTDTDTPSKPGEGTDTGSNTSLLQKILDLLKNFFDSPSDFRLNMDGFRNLAIADKFPFCIPFDLVDSIKQFAVTAKDFHFRIKLDTHYFKVDHEVDLSDMVLPFAFFRYMVLVWFVWMLMLRTRDLVKW